MKACVDDNTTRPFTAGTKKGVFRVVTCKIKYISANNVAIYTEKLQI